MSTENLLHGVRDFANGASRTRAFDRKTQEVPAAPVVEKRLL